MPAKTTKHRWIGETLNQRYRIEALIASGGMSDVYRAVDIQLESAGAADCQVAIKILKPDMLHQEGTLGVLAREVAKTRRLSHPNIIRVLDLQQDGETCFMVMELLEGEPLSRMIQRSRPNGLKWKGVREIVDQILAALRYAHKHSVVHADLKPSNIFFTRTGQIKLLDFGVSRVLNDPLEEDYLNPTRDETSVYGYTPAYSLPELAEDKEPTSKADVFALACICYELLSSQHPFNRQSLSKEERRSTRLSKPGNMPIKVWIDLKQQLLGNQNALTISRLEKAIKPLPWATAAQLTLTIGALSASAMAWQNSLAETRQARESIAKISQQQAQVAAMQDISPARLLKEVQQQPAIERAGLLKLRQESLVSHYLDQIDLALKPDADNGLPNIPKALDDIRSALALFPRDAELLRVKAQIEDRQIALQDAIDAEINSTLTQGNYNNTEDSKTLLKLAQNLEFLGGQLSRPSDTAIAGYMKRVRGALDAFDALQQAHLLTIGNRFFAGATETEAQRLELDKLKDAAIALAHYQETANTETPSSFPREAALVFYSRKFTQWSEDIENASSSNDLDKVYEDIQALKKQLPDEFDEITSAEKRLAESYLSMADTLLARNLTSRAQPLLKRATVLMR